MPSRRPTPSRTRLTLFLALATAAEHAAARIQFIALTPPAGATATFAFDTDGVQQAGCATIGGVAHACVWSGTAPSFVDLHPAQFVSSCAYGVDAGRQVGSVTVQSPPLQPATVQATLWSGSAASWVELPADGIRTTAHGISGNVVVGATEYLATPVNRFSATAWRHTGESWTSLRIFGDAAYSISGGRIAGYTSHFVGAGSWIDDACLWRAGDPTATLFPRFGESYALGVSANSLVGYEFSWGWQDRAMLWNDPGSAALDLHPPGAVRSRALAAANTRQFGYAEFSANERRACMWRGSAESYIELNTWLQQRGFPLIGWTLTQATGVSADGTTIVGNGVRNGVSTAWIIRESCTADLDNDGAFPNGGTPDGAITVDDLLYMLVAFEAGSFQADLDNGTGAGIPDQALTIADLLYFLAHFEQGC